MKTQISVKDFDSFSDEQKHMIAQMCNETMRCINRGNVVDNMVRNVALQFIDSIKEGKKVEQVTGTKMTSVKSSNINKIGYDGGGCLFVRFNNGGLYRYDNIPAEIYDVLMKAESKGRFLRQNIIGKYKYERLDK